MRPQENSQQNTRPETKAPVITPAQWARLVLGNQKPFGHDGMPTVWG